MKKIFYLILLFSTFDLLTLSPRLLIKLCPGCPISIDDLRSCIDVHVIHGENDKILAEQINSLDKSSENHRIILYGLVENLSKLANRVGYDFLELNENDISAVSNAIAAKEKNIPLTDDFLPRMDAKIAGLLYDLMMKVDHLLKEHNLTYWATCGTLLGAVRHNGLIPWDDDLDICMYSHDIPKLLSLKNLFEEHGLAITMHPFGFYKIYFINGKKIEIIDRFRKEYNYQNYFEWTFPYLDIFPVCLNTQTKIGHANQKVMATWPNEYFLPHELIPPFTLLPFGPMYIPTPRNAKDILIRMYGEDWNEITYCSYSHQNEDPIKKIKVALTDRSIIPYIMPVE